ncbi:universal stress protein [Massilia niastensis]|uniref:universal stress protein n=1 Tax=Massilia niastensis TaxID=544911 RepID=UPI00146D2040|nr:universal stress protein [Massilia niastensis]
MENWKSLPVATFRNPHVASTAGTDDQADLVAFLERHAIHSVIRSIEHGIDCGNALLAPAQEEDDDPIVMGSHGRSQLRESLLGGVTRTIRGRPPCRC